MRIRNHTHVPEKAKGKKRKLRDYAERLARVPREETRADVDAHSNPTKVLFPGACEQLSCGPDAACMPTNDHRQHYCLCTENGQPPTEDYKCPRNTALLSVQCAPRTDSRPPRTTSALGTLVRQDNINIASACPPTTTASTTVCARRTDSRPPRTTSALGTLVRQDDINIASACPPTTTASTTVCAVCTENGQPPTEDYKCPRNTGETR
ncbi:unnamed protein product [Plutella xylostella]|uniref:(diamondback moth) hypothetical protein n=1 Tax=Plutella xylostella TaxID=51655 RepID=A0A8S4DII4_PLUXY|nr:unnamed protein product [Plutella xylostella]